MAHVNAMPDKNNNKESEPGDENHSSAVLAQSIGQNLRKLRVRGGYSLERLAQLSKVSRAMLGQIELGKSVPTINVLWKIARALDVPFSALNIDDQFQSSRLMRLSDSKRLTSHDGSFTSRALFPHDTERLVEFYELELVAGGSEHAYAHAPGTTENLVVTEGEVEIRTGGTSYRLKKGDAIFFQADVPDTYHNPTGQKSVMYLVMKYNEKQL